MSDLPTINQLEGLFVNNADVDEIRAHLSRFNPIKTMGMERMEIRHSAILGWLLSPQETHGLGDKFLKAFLAEALRGHDESLRPSALQVSQADMMDADIRREWRNIDLLVLSPANGWIFIIENKFDSGLHGGQLQTYMDVITSTYMGGDTYQSVRGVFLTLWDEEADERYAPINYASICELLERQVLSGNQPLTNEVEIFIKHYLHVIREATGMSQERTDMEKLARQLYRDHKRVLDFIVDHGKSTDFNIACEEVFGEDLDYPDPINVSGLDLIFNHTDAHTISFLPKTWFDAFGGDDYYWDGCENWWAGFPVIMWLQLVTGSDGNEGKIRLYAEIGPITNYEFRRTLIESVSSIAREKKMKRIGFQSGASNEGKKYSKFLKQNSYNVDDIHDAGKISDAMLKALKSFQPEIDAIAEILPQYRHYGLEDTK